MENKHKKLFVIQAVKKALIYTYTMHQNAFGGRALPGPAGELMRSPKPSSRNQGAYF